MGPSWIHSILRHLTCSGTKTGPYFGNFPSIKNFPSMNRGFGGCCIIEEGIRIWGDFGYPELSRKYARSSLNLSQKCIHTYIYTCLGGCGNIHIPITPLMRPFPGHLIFDLILHSGGVAANQILLRSVVILPSSTAKSESGGH